MKVNDIMTGTEAALYVGVSEKSLAKWRFARKGPPHFHNEEGRVRYAREAIDVWRATQTVTIRYSPKSLKN